jgi:hypothetical protein
LQPDNSSSAHDIHLFCQITKSDNCRKLIFHYSVCNFHPTVPGIARGMRS